MYTRFFKESIKKVASQVGHYVNKGSQQVLKKYTKFNNFRKEYAFEILCGSTAAGGVAGGAAGFGYGVYSLAEEKSSNPIDKLAIPAFTTVTASGCGIFAGLGAGLSILVPEAAAVGIAVGIHMDNKEKENNLTSQFR